MSSADDSNSHHGAATDNESTPQLSRASSRRPSHTPDTPRKRRRVEPNDPARVRKYYLEGKYNDAYRVVFNEHVSRAAARFEPSDGVHHRSTQYGASTWSADEHAMLFAALERLGRDDVPGIAHAIGSKTVTETRELLLLLHDAATRNQHVGLTMHDVPAAIELGQPCIEELDVMAEALAWYQEQFEAAQEQERFGDYWLITPTVAEDLENAIQGPSRAASTRPTTPAEPGTPRVGQGIAGSCARCKHHKLRCDRNVPCSNCARMKKDVVCEYKTSKPINQLGDLATSVAQTPPTPILGQAHDHIADTSTPAPALILQAVPQAALLHAENMLLLSKHVFMNRSLDIPSPWPHWSTYASEQVPEPSILRTAFNDFHTLVVSVTKRLMQTAVMQATSRLRSQRRRVKKGTMPFVKTRDVLSAIDVLGLDRNGRSRWTGVARRCNLRVFDEHRTTRFKIKQRELSWDQTEQILRLYDVVTAPSTTGIPSSEPSTDTEGNEAFKRRAARSGTPLPMEQLSLSKSNSDTDLEDGDAEYDSAFSDDPAEESLHYVHRQYRDSAGRYASVVPGDAEQAHVQETQSLHRFDQEASRHEEEALHNLLGFSADVKGRLPSEDTSEDDNATERDKIATSTDDWRIWTAYQATWEEFQSPVPAARFAANQKPYGASVGNVSGLLRNVDETSGDESDASSISPIVPQQSRQKKPAVVELRTRNPRSYAAMQSNAIDAFDDASMSDQFGRADLDADVPAQSVEKTEFAQNMSLQDDMDWQ